MNGYRRRKLEGTRIAVSRPSGDPLSARSGGRVLEVLALVMLGARAGGDGVLRAIPVGVIEVSDWQTRFVPVTVRKRLAAAVLAGIRLGVWQGAKTALKTRGHLASCSTPPKFAYGPSELT